MSETTTEPAQPEMEHITVLGRIYDHCGYCSPCKSVHRCVRCHTLTCIKCRNHEGKCPRCSRRRR